MNWPDQITAMFPAVVIFYKTNKPKPRPGQIVGYRHKGNYTSIGNAILSPVYKKNKKLTGQNAYRVATCLITTADELGTAVRSLKHKGYSKIVSLVNPTKAEMECEKNNWRYLFIKYKDFDDLKSKRKIADPEFQELCDRLKTKYQPQTQLF